MTPRFVSNQLSAKWQTRELVALGRTLERNIEVAAISVEYVTGQGLVERQLLTQLGAFFAEHSDQRRPVTTHLSGH